MSTDAPKKCPACRGKGVLSVALQKAEKLVIIDRAAWNKKMQKINARSRAKAAASKNKKKPTNG